MEPDYCLSEVNLKQRELWVLFKKAIESETEDDHCLVTEGYHCASTSAVLHSLQEEHRTRNNAEKGQQGTDWLSVKRHLMTTFWLAEEAIEEDMNAMEKTHGGWLVNPVMNAISHCTRKGMQQMKWLDRRLRQRKYFFTVFQSWNSLPWDVVEVRTVNGFKEW